VHLSIGEVAERSGVAISAIRYYEDLGMLTSERSAGNQRRFPRDVLRRIAFIRAAQRVGLTLDEIAAALASLPSGRSPTRHDWEALSATWQPRLDEQIRELVALRDQLASCIGCGCLSLDTCALYNPDEDSAASLGAGPRYLLGDHPDDVSAH
jgi:MerR family transcriptional regulator, redox-sensitive transcriptional activator SoxR